MKSLNLIDLSHLYEMLEMNIHRSKNSISKMKTKSRIHNREKRQLKICENLLIKIKNIYEEIDKNDIFEDEEAIKVSTTLVEPQADERYCFQCDTNFIDCRCAPF